MLFYYSLASGYNIRGWLTEINNPVVCAIQAGDQLADMFSMGLDYDNNANGAAPQYNGNIAAIQWRSNINGTCLTRQQYRFTYDFANRLLTANHFTHNVFLWANTNNYSESNITYDLNGNLKTYNRRGQMPDLSFNIIDNLTYTYGDAARPDRLTNVTDLGNANKGFKYVVGAAAYQYDLNGNLTQHNHKKLSLAYNYLNLPNYIVDLGDADITLTLKSGTTFEKHPVKISFHETLDFQSETFVACYPAIASVQWIVCPEPRYRKRLHDYCERRQPGRANPCRQY